MDLTRDRIRVIAGLVVVAALMLIIPATSIAAYYIAFLYLVFFWISMATSWTILSGFAGYWSFGHAAFFGTGVYTAATLATKFDWPFLWTIPAAGCSPRRSEPASAGWSSGCSGCAASFSR